jgi:glutathione S-transferase
MTMSTNIELGDTKLRYASIAEARTMTGLRLVLGNYTIPGPWRESCKALFYVKQIPYVPVCTGDAGTSDVAMGMQGSQTELMAWTGQASQPVAVWNDERPRSSWIDQLNLAERLQPDPPLIPAGIADRMLMFGLVNEIAGEYGLGWLKRLLTIDHHLTSLASGAEGREFFEFLGRKYGYTPELAAAAPGRIVEILGTLDAQLAAQQRAGRRYLVGDAISAADIHWATFCGFFDPLPPECCPMTSAFRAPHLYGTDNPDIARALTPALLAHRDFIYDAHLEMPIVF